MKQMIVACVLVSVSCASVGGASYQQLAEQLKSENSLMKGRLVLLQRENHVLRNENLLGKKEIQNLGARIEKLAADIESLREKHRGELALKEGQLQDMLKKNDILRQESSQKIQELMQLAKDIELRLGNEAKRLGAELSKQQESFNGERERLRTEAAGREFALFKEIEALKKALAMKDGEIAGLKSVQSELRLGIDERTRLLEEQRKQISALEKAIEEWKAKAAAIDKQREDDKKEKAEKAASPEAKK